MPVHRHTDQAKCLTTLTVTGVFSPEEMLQAIEDLRDNPPTKNVLWDMREASPANSFGAMEMEELSSLANASIGAQPEIKTACVASSNFTFGMLRMYNTNLGFKCPARKIEVFRSLDDALKWLEIGN